MEEKIKKLELVYCTMASFNILMQNFYKLQQGKTEKVKLYVNQCERALNAVHHEYLTMLSVSKVKKYLRYCLIYVPCKQLCNSMCYLYDVTRIMYPQLMTARLAQSEGKDSIAHLREQIAQL